MPRAQKIEDLRQSLLYNNTLEVWTAFCGERKVEWKDLRKYQEFLDHLRSQGIRLDVSVVCPPIKGFSDKPPKAYNIKLDDENIRKIRLFNA
jgi:hypothetical protein